MRLKCKQTYIPEKTGDIGLLWLKRTEVIKPREDYDQYFTVGKTYEITFFTHGENIGSYSYSEFRFRIVAYTDNKKWEVIDLSGYSEGLNFINTIFEGPEAE